MFDRDLDCLAPACAQALPVHAVRPGELQAFLDASASGPFLRAGGFTAAAGEIRLLPDPAGLAGAVFGLGDRQDPRVFGALAFGLPEGDWRLEPGSYAPADAVLGHCLGAYQYTALKAARRPPARLVADSKGVSADAARATWLARDLINTPADRLGPAELAQAVADLGGRFGAVCEQVAGAKLATGYPAIAAVGAGSDRAPVVAKLHWRGSRAADHAPLLVLCGKGVCFDTGGLDLKPSAGMLRMKKDMGGAAIMLGLARMIMSADLSLRLTLLVGCVENSVSGRAMRPSDVLRTRAGLTVEVGNTDAEGRLVLGDLLAEACERAPDLVIDAATLTGAARVALGPEIVAMFSNDDAVAATLQTASMACHDPVWRLPLWAGYDGWLNSRVADINNVASRPFAGAIVAGLYLQRFVTNKIRWIHLDSYAWNDTGSAGRPEGGEPLGMHAALAAVRAIFGLGCTLGTVQ